MRVFPLWHSYEREDAAEDVKLCGIYSTRALAEAAQARLITQPGFRDRPDGFFVDEYEVDQICWPEGYISADKL
jgi:homoserine kinase type II